MAVVRVTPSGIMDKDTDMAYVSQGNYVDANDIRHRQTDGSTFGGVMSVAGNKHMLTIPSYGSSSKTFRIYVDLSKIADGSVSSNDGDLYLEDTFGIVYSNLSLNITGTSIPAYIATLKGFFNTLSNAAYGGLFTYSATTITGTYTAYFDISTALDTDYVLRVNNITYELCTIKLKNEYYGTGGDFKVIGSQQLQDYLFVWLAGDVVSSGITSEVSEIGVIYTVDGGSTYNYQRLLRSKKMGFSTQRRVEAEIERNGDEVNLYWTDGYGKPRAMYLKYSLITTQDAFLFTSGGRYELETIDDESSLFYKVSNAYFDNIQVQETGGFLTSGNKRYTGRFLTEDFVPTDFLYPTNPINIYSSKLSVASEIRGDADNTSTNKSVSLTVKNFQPGIYKYFELIALEYTDATFTSKIVQRFSLSEDDVELNVQHTNLGQENIILSNNELLAITSKYLTVENIKVFDNRMTLSNLVEQVDLDLNSWAQNIEHSIEQGYIEGIGKSFELTTNLTKSYTDHKLGEYLDPLNTYDFTSYVYNDTYRFGIQVQWKNTGKWSAPYWVDDIRVDRAAANVIGTRRIASTSGVDINLQDTSNNRVKYYYVKFHNVDLDAVVGGQYVRDLISGFRFVRSKRIPEVLATGIFYAASRSYERGPNLLYPFLGIRNINQNKGGYFSTINTTTNRIQILASNLAIGDEIRLVSTASYVPTGGTPGVFFVIFVSSTEIAVSSFSGGPIVDWLTSAEGFISLPTSTPEPLYRNTSVYNLAGEPQILSLGYTSSSGVQIRCGGTQHTTDESNHLYFYSPDLYFNNASYTYNAADKIKLAAKPFEHEIYSGYSKAGQRFFDGSNNSAYQDYGGYFGATTQNYTEFSITDHVHLEVGASETIGSATINNNFGYVNADFTTQNSQCEVFKLTTTAHNNTALADNGMWYGQLFRDLGANKKYPVNKELSSYESIGHFYILSNGQNGVIDSISVYGGDSFIQKSHMSIIKNPHDNSLWGGGYAISFYSQNSGNLQMFNILDHDDTFAGPGYVFPQYLDKSNAGRYWVDYLGSPSTLALPSGSIGNGLFYWIEQWPEVSNQNNYSRSYNYRDDSIVESGYNSENVYDGSLPSRITWSAKKVIGSQKDNYRIFKPIDFADLDLTLGPIVHHDIINAALYTWQPYSVQRQYFREASLIGAQEGTDIVVGSGSILGSPGQELTAIGADYKWSVVKGNTPNGKESAYWFNARLKKFVRFGQDGNRVISDKGLISYLQNNTRFLEYYPYPLTGQGIHGIWNDKYAEAIFSFKAKNPSIPTWEVATYVVGDYVFISPLTTYIHPSGLPYAYKCKLGHTASALTKPETGANWQTYWTKITPGTDSYAHTLFTIVYDEIKNGFITFHSYWPDIYLKYRNSFWSPNPLIPERMHLHDIGNESEYYENYYPPTITAVMNYDPNISKNFEALQMVTDQQPFFVDLTTPNHISYLDETEFEEREDLWYSPIKNDSTSTGLNNGNTSRLWGKWLKVKLSLEASGGKQKLINFIVKFRTMARLFNQ
jgi:hypothetical protein